MPVSRVIQEVSHLSGRPFTESPEADGRHFSRRAAATPDRFNIYVKDGTGAEQFKISIWYVLNLEVCLESLVGNRMRSANLGGEDFAREVKNDTLPLK